MLLKPRRLRSERFSSLHARGGDHPICCGVAADPTNSRIHTAQRCEQRLLELQSSRYFQRCFFDICPDAPGLHIVGGEALSADDQRRFSFTGTGLKLCEAVTRALGEANEIGALLAGQRAGVNGLGAAFDRDSAVCHGIFELIEHDALALWWFAGKRPPQLDPSGELKRGLLSLLTRLQHNPARKPLLLDLSCDTEIPVVAAVSFDAYGQCYALGSAARSSYSAALDAAIREMCQMEYAHHVVRAKLKMAGYTGLSEPEKATIKRATLIDQPALSQWVSPLQDTTPFCVPPNSVELKHYLSARKIEIDSREIGADQQAMRVFLSTSPQLQSLQLINPTQRLLREMKKNTSASPHQAFEQLLP